MRYLTLSLLFAVAAATGCTSITSTMLNRYEQDNYSINDPTPCKRDGLCDNHTKGVPITLSVFTHVDVRVVETLYLQNTETGLERVELGAPEYDVITTPIKTKKVFTVDFKRPAAGTLDYAADFDEEQYFKKFKNKIVDNTIKDITFALTKVRDIVPAVPTAFINVGEIENSLITVKRDVAFCRFDINDPDFESDLRKFSENNLTRGITMVVSE